MPAFSTGNTGASTGFNPLDAGTDLLGGLLTGVGGFLGGPAGSLLGTGLGIDALNEMRGLGKEAQTEALRIGERAQADTAFKPFTISTGFGGVQTTPEGGFTTSLSPAMAAQQKQLQAITSGLLGGVGGMGGMGRQTLQPGTLTEDMMRFRPEFTSGPARLPGTPAPPTMYTDQLTGERVTQEQVDTLGGMGARLGAQPSQAPMAPSTGGFGTGIPDISGIQGTALGGIEGLLAQAQGSTAGREQDIYNRIRATQLPEEQRQQLALNEQLASQGRTGLRTAMFGGSPEQFAMEKARAEAMNQASLASIGQAQAQREADLAAATGMFGLGSSASFLPSGLREAELGNIGASMGLGYQTERELLASLTPAISLADIAGTGRREGAGLFTEAGAAGLEANLGAQKTRAEGLAGLYNSLLNAQGSAASSAAGSVPSFFNTAGDWLTGLFD